MVQKFLSTRLGAVVNEHVALLFFRVLSAIFILTHGIPKLMKVFSGDFAFPDPIGLGSALSLVLAAFAEGICGFLILIGLGTRLASMVLIINMAMAGFIFHAADPFGTKEKALLYLIIFITTALLGSGKYSLDNKISGN